MHIVIIAWLFVILMMAITEKSVIGGVMTFVFYGLAPCALMLWLVATHRRNLRLHRQRKAAAGSMRHEQPEDGDGAHAQPDQQDLKQ
jgi:hypothetical protein